MIQFAKPTQLNGSQLVSELTTAGIIITEPPMIDGNGKFWLNIDPNDVAKATPIVALHIGIDMGAVERTKISALKASIAAKRISITWVAFTQAEADYLNSGS